MESEWGPTETCVVVGAAGSTGGEIGAAEATGGKIGAAGAGIGA